MFFHHKSVYRIIWGASFISESIIRNKVFLSYGAPRFDVRTLCCS